jgi:putative FmdB family regulatory protein
MRAVQLPDTGQVPTMPIYEYQCEGCGHTLETLQKISDPPLTRCPVCGAEALKKLVSASGFRLKGGGWYETDFKTGSKKNVAGDKKDGKSGKDGAAAGKAADSPKKTDTSSPKK